VAGKGGGAGTSTAAGRQEAGIRDHGEGGRGDLLPLLAPCGETR